MDCLTRYQIPDTSSQIPADPSAVTLWNDTQCNYIIYFYTANQSECQCQCNDSSAPSPFRMSQLIFFRVLHPFPSCLSPGNKSEGYLNFRLQFLTSFPLTDKWHLIASYREQTVFTFFFLFSYFYFFFVFMSIFKIIRFRYQNGNKLGKNSVQIRDSFIIMCIFGWMVQRYNDIPFSAISDWGLGTGICVYCCYKLLSTLVAFMTLQKFDIKNRSFSYYQQRDRKSNRRSGRL